MQIVLSIHLSGCFDRTKGLIVNSWQLKRSVKILFQNRSEVVLGDVRWWKIFDVTVLDELKIKKHKLHIVLGRNPFIDAMESNQRCKREKQVMSYESYHSFLNFNMSLESDYQNVSKTTNKLGTRSTYSS